jgi:acetolactate synthase small subunit
MLEQIDDFRAFVLNESETQMMLSLSARPARLDEFEALLRPYGITELQRTGRVALPALRKNQPAITG